MEMDNQPKKRVLVVGNGFDIAIGRKTGYPDFYQSKYCPKHYPAPVIAWLNEKLGDRDDVKWYDLESELQNYAIEANKNGNADGPFYSEEEKKVIYYLKTTSCEPISKIYREVATGVECFNEIEADLVNRNILYVDSWGVTRVPFELSELTQTYSERDRIALQMIKQGLSAFLNNMPDEQHKVDNLAYLLMKESLEDIQERTIVYSFNYTDISRAFTKDEYRADDFDERIHYVHGSLKTNDIIIGAKDGDYGKYNFLQKVFDPDYTSSTLLPDLLAAEEVVIYGHSLGDCDSQYFEPFFYQQVQPNATRKTITIYTFDEKSKEDIKCNLQKLTGNKLSYLCNMNTVEIFTKEQADKKAKENQDIR